MPATDAEDSTIETSPIEIEDAAIKPELLDDTEVIALRTNVLNFEHDNERSSDDTPTPKTKRWIVVREYGSSHSSTRRSPSQIVTLSQNISQSPKFFTPEFFLPDDNSNASFTYTTPLHKNLETLCSPIVLDNEFPDGHACYTSDETSSVVSLSDVLEQMTDKKTKRLIMNWIKQLEEIESSRHFEDSPSSDSEGETNLEINIGLNATNWYGDQEIHIGEPSTSKGKERAQGKRPAIDAQIDADREMATQLQVEYAQQVFKMNWKMTSQKRKATTERHQSSSLAAEIEWTSQRLMGKVLVPQTVSLDPPTRALNQIPPGGYLWNAIRPGQSEDIRLSSIAEDTESLIPQPSNRVHVQTASVSKSIQSRTPQLALPGDPSEPSSLSSSSLESDAESTSTSSSSSSTSSSSNSANRWKQRWKTSKKKQKEKL
ncbi:hypothetical protein FRC02_012309 [Tulasnella sp. 418]|nr:hypothetical protein FRC02_012309 [Tulasnella sp. 418]